MPPLAYVAHQSRGRLRLKVPSRRGDGSYFAALVQELSKHGAIQELRADPRRAGLVIHHDGLADAIIALAAEEDLFLMAPGDIEPSGRVSPTMLDTTAIALSGLALAQAAGGELLGSASESFWSAYGSLRILRRPGLAALFTGFGVVQLIRGEIMGSASSLLFYCLLMRRQAEELSRP